MPYISITRCSTIFIVVLFAEVSVHSHHNTSRSTSYRLLISVTKCGTCMKALPDGEKIKYCMLVPLTFCHGCRALSS